MSTFAQRTGLIPPADSGRRYLWTDAFAVCNYLELFRLTAQQSFRDTAIELIEKVHHSLGKFNPKDPRTGWLSGLDDSEGARHPTSGGLRIGKPLAERRPDEPPDAQREWQMDGQYFHYLTRWMHALNQASQACGDPAYHRWAIELAQVSHRHFTFSTSHGKRMYWKMSVDLSRPLVDSMGLHDPLDALVCYLQLANTSPVDTACAEEAILSAEIDDCRAMCIGKTWATPDSLGTGGLLIDACHLTQLQAASEADITQPVSLALLLADSLAGLLAFADSRTLEAPARQRLAFRELGLAIALQSVNIMQASVLDHRQRFNAKGDLASALAKIGTFMPIGDEILRFWLSKPNQQCASWSDHRDINEVMLASCLVPGGLLRIHPRSTAA